MLSKRLRAHFRKRCTRMSFYNAIFEAPKTGVKCFLWKINEFGEVVIEYLNPQAAGIVDSGRDMCVVGKAGEYEFSEMLNIALKKAGSGHLRVVEVPELWTYGVCSIEELLKKLNTKGSNHAKVLWRALQEELQYPGIVWDEQSKAYVLETKKQTGEAT